MTNPPNDPPTNPPNDPPGGPRTQPPSNPPTRPPRALVTGATSGIGRAIALALAERGYQVLATGRDPARLAALMEALNDASPTREALPAHPATGIAADLQDDAAMDALVAQVAAEPLDVLVHSAGVVRLGNLESTSPEVLDWHHRVNVRAPFRLTVALLPALRTAKGHVVFVNSGAGKRANPGWGAYAASKFALRALADSFRAELAADGVRVTSVFPGRTATPMQQAVRESEGQPYDPDSFVRPEDVAAQVVALLTVRPPGVVSEVDIRPI